MDFCARRSEQVWILKQGSLNKHGFLSKFLQTSSDFRGSFCEWALILHNTPLEGNHIFDYNLARASFISQNFWLGTKVEKSCLIINSAKKWSWNTVHKNHVSKFWSHFLLLKFILVPKFLTQIFGSNFMTWILWIKKHGTKIKSQKMLRKNHDLKNVSHSKYATRAKFQNTQKTCLLKFLTYSWNVVIHFG